MRVPHKHSFGVALRNCHARILERKDLVDLPSPNSGPITTALLSNSLHKSP